VTGQNARAAREVGRHYRMNLKGSAVLGSALDALGCRRRWAAVQKQRTSSWWKAANLELEVLMW